MTLLENKEYIDAHYNDLLHCKSIRYFVRFLKENGCYVKYLKNIKDSIGRYKLMSLNILSKCLLGLQQDQLINNENAYPNEPISRSFLFMNTKEGHSYWQRLNSKLYEEYCSLKYKNFK